MKKHSSVQLDVPGNWTHRFSPAEYHRNVAKILLEISAGHESPAPGIPAKGLDTVSYALAMAVGAYITTEFAMRKTFHGQDTG